MTTGTGDSPIPAEVSSQAAADLLQLSPRRLRQLAADGWIPAAGRGRYPLAGLVQGYASFLMASGARRTKSANEGRLKEARARLVEQRIAREDRGLIDLQEALDAFEDIAGAYAGSIAGLPARIAMDPSERRRIQVICDAERLRVSDRFAEIASALRTGRGADDAGGEDAADA